MRDVVLSFLASEHIDIESEDHEHLHVAFSGESGRFQGLVRVDEDTGVLAFYALCPVEVPRERMAPALELMARLNYGHVLGNLELDVDTGLIRFKTSLDIEGEEPTEGLVANCVYANIASIEQMLPAIRAVCLENKDVHTALQTIIS